MRFRAGLCALSLSVAAPLVGAHASNPYPALRIMDGRVAAIGYRLTRDNADWCRNQRHDRGVRTVRTRDFPPSSRAAALVAYDVQAGFSGEFVVVVVPGSPAAEFGARVGQNFAELALSDTGTRLHCSASISVKASDTFYAATDGFAVQISAALINRTRDDDELAALLAHELAHVVLEHPGTLKGKRGISRVKSTERDADQLSVWLMARAGYDPQAAVRFWTHYGPKRDKGIFNAPTHDNWKNRVARLTSEITAMQAARADNKNAIPNVSGLRTYP